jgi:hypothetical protein
VPLSIDCGRRKSADRELQTRAGRPAAHVERVDEIDELNRPPASSIDHFVDLQKPWVKIPTEEASDRDLTRVVQLRHHSLSDIFLHQSWAA